MEKNLKDKGRWDSRRKFDTRIEKHLKFEFEKDKCSVVSKHSLLNSYLFKHIWLRINGENWRVCSERVEYGAVIPNEEILIKLIGYWYLSDKSEAIWAI